MESPILVTGGTGTLGRLVVPLLRDAVREIRVLSRRTHEASDGTEFVTGDTGEGINAAVDGTEIVVHCAGSSKGDQDKARHLVTAASRARVRHLLYISVVGADRIPIVSAIDRAMFRYFRSKLAAEQAVGYSGIGATKTLWLWWSGPRAPDLGIAWHAYLRRFDIEHTFRFVKNTLGWTMPSLRTPEQADRWTWHGHRRLHAATPRARPRQRHTPALGTPPRTRPADPGACPEGISPGPRHSRHPSQSTNSRHPRPRTPQRHPHRATNPPPSDQEGSLTPSRGLIAS